MLPHLTIIFDIYIYNTHYQNANSWPSYNKSSKLSTGSFPEGGFLANIQKI